MRHPLEVKTRRGSRADRVAVGPFRVTLERVVLSPLPLYLLQPVTHSFPIPPSTSVLGSHIYLFFSMIYVYKRGMSVFI